MKDVFELTPELIALLRASYVNERLSWCEYGAAEIDPKRPYGNSDVERDIAELFGFPIDDDGRLTEEVSQRCRKLHEQTPVALQVVLSTGSFQCAAGTIAMTDEGRIQLDQRDRLAAGVQ